MSNDKKPVNREYKSLREINKENNRQFKVNRAQIKQDLRAQKKENKIIKKQDKLNYINEHGRLKYHATQGKTANWVKSQVKQSVPFQSVQQGIYALDDKYQKTKARVTNLRDGIKESGGLKKYAGQSIKNKVVNSKAGRAVTKGKKIAGHIKNAPANIKKGLKEYNPVALGKKGASSVKNLGADLSAKGLKATAFNRAGRLGGAIGKTKLGKNAINGVKGAANAITNKFKAVMDALNKAKTLIVAFKIPILIGLAIITVLETVVPAAIATTSELGTSPHYYCNMDAPKEVKESEIWQRYCNSGSHLELENLNGHYVYQTGSGPCLGCAYINLLMRYFTAQGENFFEYLFDETGEYRNPINHNGKDIDLVWAIYQKGGGVWESGEAFDSTGIEFLAKVGKPNANWATIGYLRNEDVYEEPTSEILNATDWVYDKNLGYASDSSFNASWSGTYTIGDVTATCVMTTISSREQLANMLMDHPTGVVIWGKYSTCTHGFLISGYEDGQFICIDSASGKKMFETPEDQLYSGSREILSMYAPPYNVMYVKEDTN